jgi:pSer/pThr/pTyr-binding forkhead associated (FHA) protein
MGLDLIGKILTVLVIVVIYIIIIIALRIMYKDIKNQGRKSTKRNTFGLEVISPGPATNLKKGSVIPVGRLLTIGRKEDNLLPIGDNFVSGHHTKIYVKNNTYYIEDLKSTNGTLLNSESIDKAVLNPGDHIKIGEVEFVVI